MKVTKNEEEDGKYTALGEPVEVNLKKKGNEWIGLTEQLEKGKYLYKIVYHLKCEELGEELVEIDREHHVVD
jgi:hypothetical protein